MSVAQSCLILCDPLNGSPPGSSVHGISQTRILEWVAISSSRGSSQPRDRSWASHIAGKFFTVWATREGQYYIKMTPFSSPLIFHYYCHYYYHVAAWAPCWSTVSHCPTQTWLLPMACGTSVPWPGIEPVTSALEDGFLSTGQRGRSLSTFRQ